MKVHLYEVDQAYNCTELTYGDMTTIRPVIQRTLTRAVTTGCTFNGTGQTAIAIGPAYLELGASNKTTVVLGKFGPPRNTWLVMTRPETTVGEIKREIELSCTKS